MLAVGCAAIGPTSAQPLDVVVVELELVLVVVDELVDVVVVVGAGVSGPQNTTVLMTIFFAVVVGAICANNGNPMFAASPHDSHFPHDFFHRAHSAPNRGYGGKHLAAVCPLRAGLRPLGAKTWVTVRVHYRGERAAQNEGSGGFRHGVGGVTVGGKYSRYHACS